jgi:wobble nucleotide-excising tRNase
MIESIQIEDVAYCFNDPENLCDLSKFNFFYGVNATGKTTISRVIANEGSFPTCKLSWKGGTRLQPMVYNQDFVETNFNQIAELKGVFTLGEENIDIIDKIASGKIKLDEITNNIEILNKGLHGDDGTGGKKGKLAALETELRNKCWAQKQKHDAKLQGAFEGFRNNAENFKGKVLQEWVSNSAKAESLVDLEKKAETVFGPTPATKKSISSLGIDAIIVHESDPILKKRVIGKDDVNIAAMIKKLGNSDWVREGRGFYDSNEKVCPFCQQSTTDAFAQSLKEYFDETFETDSKAIEDLVTKYEIDSAQLQQQISSIIGDSPKFLDVEKLKIEKELFDSIIMANFQRLAKKKKEPSQVIELESISNVVSVIEALIEAANLLIA